MQHVVKSTYIAVCQPSSGSRYLRCILADQKSLFSYIYIKFLSQCKTHQAGHDFSKRCYLSFTFLVKRKHICELISSHSDHYNCLTHKRILRNMNLRQTLVDSHLLNTWKKLDLLLIEVSLIRKMSSEAHSISLCLQRLKKTIFVLIGCMSVLTLPNVARSAVFSLKRQLRYRTMCFLKLFTLIFLLKLYIFVCEHHFQPAQLTMLTNILIFSGFVLHRGMRCYLWFFYYQKLFFFGLNELINSFYMRTLRRTRFCWLIIIFQSYFFTSYYVCTLSHLFILTVLTLTLPHICRFHYRIFRLHPSSDLISYFGLNEQTRL